MGGQPRASRSITAEALLKSVTKRLGELESFLEDDQTTFLYTVAQIQGDTDRRTAYLLAKSGKSRHRLTASELFKRLLAVRYLAASYETWLQDTGEGSRIGTSEDHPKNHGLCGSFMREQKLPATSQARGWIECGQKLLRIERNVGLAGASLALMLALPKFPHFYEAQVTELIRLLNHGQFPEVMQMALQISPRYLIYIDVYGKLLDTTSPVYMKSSQTNEPITASQPQPRPS